MAVALSGEVEAVRDFWNAHPCGAQFVQAPFGTPEFFRQYAGFRYGSEHHLNRLVPFEHFRGKRVLEVGCGLGADGARFAQNGAIYTGIDLTPAAVEATRLHFQSLGLPGTFKVQNAESMEQIESEIFDLVYSHGVLHHTPDIRAALGEIWRVLKPGGELTLMLYHRRSFNYYVRILTFMRLQVLTYLAARRFLPARRRSGPLEMHYRGYARMGAKYLSSAEFPHHCTDGPECPLARAFTPREVEHLLGPAFTDLRFAVAHLPLHKRLPFVPLGVERFLASRLGWYLFVFARKA